MDSDEPLPKFEIGNREACKVNRKIAEASRALHELKANSYGGWRDRETEDVYEVLADARDALKEVKRILYRVNGTEVVPLLNQVSATLSKIRVAWRALKWCYPVHMDAQETPSNARQKLGEAASSARNIGRISLTEIRTP